ncbi:holo-ACP synthase [Streptomyces sp. NPDC052051]|uniref:holo-ACP synthase n=1 Tax=Streptomyces sp. NPDC052051 TaxID=3154649 RepID=UPI00342718A3
MSAPHRRPPRVVGVGIDLAVVSRFGRALERHPELRERLFTRTERTLPSGAPRGIASLAARFAAKEAVTKALGGPPGLRWHDTEIRTGPAGEPILHISGTVREAARLQGIGSWYVSLTHDGDLASAMVVAAR